MKSAAAIRTTTKQIEARGSRSAQADEMALQMMVDLWPVTLDIVRQCGGWTATAGADFMAQLDAMRRQPKRGDGERLDALEHAIPRTMPAAWPVRPTPWAAAADGRRSDERARLLSRGPAVPAGLPAAGSRRACDGFLRRPVREQVIALDRCRSRLKWITGRGAHRRTRQAVPIRTRSAIRARLGAGPRPGILSPRRSSTRSRRPSPARPPHAAAPTGTVEPVDGSAVT